MEKDRIPLWKAAIAGSILGTLFPEWALKIQNRWKEQVFQDKVRKLEEKLAKAKPKDRSKIEREICFSRQSIGGQARASRSNWPWKRRRKGSGLSLTTT
jgi:hypothetical protein